MKKIVLILTMILTLCGLTGCENNEQNLSGNNNQVDAIGTWNYDGTKVEITKDKVNFNGGSYDYEQKGKWIIVKEREMTIYILDNENIIAFESIALEKEN